MLRGGETFAEYVIEREVGRGGMGTVYLARHPRLPRLTVLKVLNRDLFSDPESRARFEREAELAARLDHPNIVSVYDRGSEGEQLWISMQYVEGSDASGLDGGMPAERAVRIIAEVAEGLDYAHRKGVLHRDVKPANILLEHPVDGRPERVLLSDFGIARLRDDGGHLTRTGTFTATLAYASPEQLSGTDLGPHSDQYSLACTLFRLLTGVGPFEAEHPGVIMQGHLYEAVPTLTSLRPDLPPALDTVLAKAMAKHPGDRYPTCAEFAAAARRAVTARPEPTTVRSATGSPTTVLPSPPKPARRRLYAGLAAALAATVVAAGAIWYGTAGSDASETTTSAGDHAAIWAAFPKMVPVDTKRKEGYNSARCEATSENKRKVDSDDGLDFGLWTAMWECESGGSDSKDPAFRFYAYKSAEDVRAVAALLDAKTRFTETNNGTTYTHYRVKSYWGDAIVTVFLNTDRAPFLMYTRPRSSSEKQDLVAWLKTVTLD
ncbi:serine/threonine-protein kinase [Nocardia huaxiensis]|uniref:non-specific serine/threonine protein kinase n=1 Tax=Nocardia huaxiensis TaxID=2755382 RepID=A0A7D6VCD1_9NOCA|nr:serine/threonine-protein kinase [Nocardia huaxiensis]QLY33061.1 serine/threonine protein kinase [Nocardia huaxiensis]UFS93174.1 serine/threonine protein kinase [Nocardia huaxiensis]